jgi:hypothetical protein
MSMLRKLWWGAYPLVVAFWGFYVFGFLLGGILAGSLVFSLRYFHLQTIGFLLGLILVWPYMFIASVGVWRSAKAGMASPIWMHRIWPILARVFVLASAARLLWGLMNGGALRLMAIATGHLDFDF